MTQRMKIAAWCCAGALAAVALYLGARSALLLIAAGSATALVLNRRPALKAATVVLDDADDALDGIAVRIDAMAADAHALDAAADAAILATLDTEPPAPTGDAPLDVPRSEYVAMLEREQSDRK